MKKFKSHFKFTKQERSGIFFLLLIIILIQVGYFLFKSFGIPSNVGSFAIDSNTQIQLDALRARALEKDTFEIFPFNPNYITDYKGYTLGMSIEEIDRLLAFRQLDKFVNSPEEFQRVTLISDSLLNAISPNFKFPEWTQKKVRQSAVGSKKSGGVKSTPTLASDEHKREEGIGPGEVRDLNSATAQDLKTINGIGEKLSARIVKFRDGLDGFLVDGQLYDVYGLDPEVVDRTFKKFKVLNPPEITKININTASAREIAKLVYIQKHVAKNIIDFRNLNGTIQSFDELSKIEDFPADKIDRIILYLSL